MTVLVRDVISKRASLWARAEDKSLWTNGQFPFELLHDLYDPRGGLSFYEVTSRRDPALIRIAAALHFPTANKDSKQQVESVDFRTIDTADLQRLGLTMTATAGGTGDTEVNKLHREITGITGPLAVKLARLMCQCLNVSFSAAEVAGAISRGIRNGNLPEKSLHKNMLHSLLHEGAVTIRFKAA